MFTITDYYNLIDYNGYLFDSIYSYVSDDMTFSELLTGLYNNFIDNTTKADQQTAHDFFNTSESSKHHVMELISVWAYDSISHGI